MGFNQLGLKRMAIMNCIVMFIVVMQGALVTKTGSGQGCGTDFPLCLGKFVPEMTAPSLIEYTHRLVSGIAGVLVVLTAIWVWKVMRQRREMILFAMSGVFFTFLQAVLGAIAVSYPQSSFVLALHFGFSLIAFASTLILAIIIIGKYNPTVQQKSSSVSKAFRNGVWFILFYSYIVVYIGAFIRHTDSWGGCMGWPLCNGQWFPDLSGATGIVFIHRLAAALFFIAVLSMYITILRNYRHMRVVRLTGTWIMVLVITQVLTGAVVTFNANNDWFLYAEMIHSVNITIMFGVLSYFSFLLYQLARPRIIDK